MQVTVAKGIRRGLAGRDKARRKTVYILMLMALPGVVYMIINNYLPMVGLIVAFKDFSFSKGMFGSDWSGLKNFEYLFKTTDAFIITRNTLCYNLLFIILNTVIPVLAAIFLAEIETRFFSRVYQTTILLPFLISTVIVSYLVYAFLSTTTGLFNKGLLPAFGIEPIKWYSEPKYWYVILPFVNTWKSLGYYTVIYLASIIGIDKEYYEAAALDGASRWNQIRTITVPLISKTIILMVLISVGRIFYSDFGIFYNVPMNSGMLYEATNTIDTYVYRSLCVLGDIGMASAAGFYQSVVGFVLVFLANMIVKKIDSESAVF